MKNKNWKILVEKCIYDNNANFSREYSIIKRDTQIYFTCKCGKEGHKSARCIVEPIGSEPMCKDCTKIISKNKIEKTNLKKYGHKTNLSILTSEERNKGNETRVNNNKIERGKIKICSQCNGPITSSSPKSKTCRRCQGNKSHKKRRHKKSTCIIECIKQLSSKYPEIKDHNDLVNLYKTQNGKCNWCKCELQCPHINSNYETDYNQPSLDRIDNNKDHSINNINITCWFCNNMRGETDIILFKKIMEILLGNTNILDLSNEVFIDKLFDKRYTISNDRVRNYITPKIKDIRCPISNFPFFFGKSNHYPLLPSFDRKINNKDGVRMEHSDDNINMVCSFINYGRNKINDIESFKKIFNDKFPNRKKNIKVICSKEYTNILKSKFYISKKKNICLILKFKSVIKKIIKINKELLVIQNWILINKRTPIYLNNKEELNIYRKLSEIKNYNIFFIIIEKIPYIETKTNRIKILDDWNDMYIILINFIKDKGELPKTGCQYKKLFNWCSTQKKKFKKNDLSEEQINKLNSIELWWWTEIQKGLNENIRWFIDNPFKLPNKIKNNTQYLWFYKIRKNYKEDKLIDYDLKLIKSNILLFNKWIEYDKPLSKTDKNYKIFLNTYS